MPEQDFGAGELKQSEEVTDVVLPARDEASRVVEPGKETFDAPAASVASEGAAILCGPAPRAIGRDHLDTVLIAQLCIEEVAVVAAVADESRRELAEESGVEGRGDEVRLIR